MKKETQKFLDSLRDAEHLLKELPTGTSTKPRKSSKDSCPKDFELKHFEEWAELCEQEYQRNPPIRIIQHLSCTGGTIICKCLAAMPNVTLLSEVNPLSRLHVSYKPKFAPTDLTYLALQGKFPLFEELSEEIFKAGINVISKHARQLGKYLVIREHSHSDYLVGDSSRNVSIIKNLLKNEYDILCALTVRHPVDSYLSLIANEGWVHFTPTNFDEYCKRYLLFIERNKEVPSYKYEDFLVDPKTVLISMCKDLDLPFNEVFQDVFDLNSMSGDSGRSSNVISSRERRKYDDNFRAELDGSAHYIQLCEVLNYAPSID